jgi:hypothetical protein
MTRRLAAALPFRRSAMRTVLAALVLALPLAGCSEEDLPTGVLPNGETGRVRFVHAVSDPARADRLDASLENLPLGINLAYGNVAPTLPAAAYYPVYVGSRALAARRTADTSVKVLDQSLTIAAGTDYTVLALGNAAGVQGLVLTDDNTAPTAGNVKVRVVHASASTGAVDIYVTTPTADLSTATAAATNVAFRSPTPYVSLPAGAYRIRVTPAGNRAVVSLDVTTPALAAGAIRTVLALDRALGGAPVTGVVLSDR